MKGKYSKLIQEYCDKEGINVPPGFKRQSASHLAVVRYDSGEAKLVAKTFFKKEDLKYYIANTLSELVPTTEGLLPAKAIDFKENKHFNINVNGGLIAL
ncbi:hypothetical protein Q4Q54_00040 [Shewanella sp. SP2S2-4]|uniref:hypothetical protein n=1 Tax=Shewanella sp. SP2S2-4 TaxID=3063539 RepID=UPI00288F56BB|nr:hypothetical protein [Shewanella sp. SP2S2-4]MDT3271875.1 hypothetical protein [Shewanella sp. SP2S2-4]